MSRASAPLPFPAQGRRRRDPEIYSPSGKDCPAKYAFISYLFYQPQAEISSFLLICKIYLTFLKTARIAGILIAKKH
jgi:hypothetical protein